MTVTPEEPEDLVLLRLNADIPADSIQIIQELSQATKELRVNMEANSRFTKETTEYLKDLTEAEREYQAQKESLVRVEGEAREARTPKQVADPQVGTPEVEQRKIEQERQQSAEVETRWEQILNPDSDAPGGPRDEVADLIDRLDQRGLVRRDRAGALQIRTPEGRLGVESLAEESTRRDLEALLQARVERESGGVVGQLGQFKDDFLNASNILGSRDLTGALQSTQRFAQGLGGAGGAVMGASRAVPYIGAAVAASQIADRVNEQYQEYRDLGMIQGGGVTEGLGYQMSIQSMAMSPFITNQQARQIIEGALNEGYTGREFETVTDFMATNLKDMNMTVGDSMKLMRSNIEEGEGSLEALNIQLATLKSLSQDSSSSLSDMTSTFIEASTGVVDQGAGGTAAGAYGLVVSNLFQDTGPDGERNLLADVGGGIITSLAENPQIMGRIAIKYGVPWYQAADYLTQLGPDVLPREILGFLQEYLANAPTVYHAQQRLNAIGVRLTIPQVQELLQQLPDAVDIAMEGIEERYQAVETSFGEKVGGELSSVGHAALGGLQGVVGLGRGLVGTIGTTFHGLWNPDEGFNYREQWDPMLDALSEAEKKADAAHFGSGPLRIPIAEDLIREYGLDKIIFVNEDGEGIPLSDISPYSREQMSMLEGGRFLVEGVTGDQPMTFMELQGMSGGGAGSGAGVFTGNITLDLTDRAAQVLQPSSSSGSLTMNQAQAHAGVGGASLNNLPVGDPQAGDR